MVQPNTNLTTETSLRPVPLARRRAQTARAYLALTKPLQTLLLLITGVCAYALSRPGAVNWSELAAAALALTGAVAGCTVLNMILDRDIDGRMGRTVRRPLPAGRVSVRAALIFGLALSVPGLALAWALSPLFGLIVSLGFGIDLGVYTLWLKRRTPLSILWGGISGGMPALAGRALALGRVDLVGVLLAAGVLLWIPAHILTLATHYAREYHLAGVPVWPNVYGPTATRRVIALATLLDVTVLGTAGWLLSIHPVTLGVLAVLGAGLTGLSVAVLFRPTERLNWVLFKFASLYMLGAFVCLTIGTVL
ncbi:MAG: heme o synthase [Anaerolineae bacterium]